MSEPAKKKPTSAKTKLLSMAKREKKYCVAQARATMGFPGFHWEQEGSEYHRWMGRADTWLVLQNYLEGKQ